MSGPFGASKKHIVALALIASGIVGIFYLSASSVLTIQTKPVLTMTPTLPLTQAAAPLPPAVTLAATHSGQPVRLMMPTIQVDAPLIPMSTTTTGAMKTPGNVAQGGWYQLGPRPGEIGNAVIDGHVTGLHGEPGIFSNLRKLNVGDTISVENDQGQLSHFVVRKSQVYDANADSGEVFTANDSTAHLNLITCTGTWDKLKKEYASRLVVFTDLVNY